MATKPARHETLPKYLILEGGIISNELERILHSGDALIDCYTGDCIDAYLAQVVDSVYVKRNRMAELESFVSSLKYQYEREGETRIATPLAKCVFEAGLVIIRQLDMMGAYLPDGTLHYTFFGRDQIGGIILERVELCHTTNV